jgi:hypothetical protein
MQPNHSLAIRIWRFIKPSLEECIGYVLAIGVLAGIGAYQLAAQGSIGVDTKGIINAASDAVSAAAAYLSSGSGWAQFFLFGFWFIIGAIAYFAAWFAINLIVDLYNDLVISAAFVHPRSFHQSDFWAAIVVRVLLRVVSGIALTFYIFFWLWIFAPLWIHVFEKFFSAPLAIQNIIDATSAIIGVAITLHIAVVLLRLTLLHPPADPLEDRIV